jgi:FeS assembly protein IscX
MHEELSAPLYWEASYEIVLALRERYPQRALEELGLAELREMIVALPHFADEPALGNEALLRGILREWYEETDCG